eukprot:5322377-Amphidinium_carterae.2
MDVSADASAEEAFAPSKTQSTRCGAFIYHQHRLDLHYDHPKQRYARGLGRDCRVVPRQYRQVILSAL